MRSFRVFASPDRVFAMKEFLRISARCGRLANTATKRDDGGVCHIGLGVPQQQEQALLCSLIGLVLQPLDGRLEP